MRLDVEGSERAARGPDLFGDVVAAGVVLGNGTSECALATRLLALAGKVVCCRLLRDTAWGQRNIAAVVNVDDRVRVSARHNDVEGDLAVLDSLGGRDSGADLGNVLIENQSD